MGFLKKIRTLLFLSACLGTTLSARAATKSYCVNVDYSAVPALVNYRKITLNVNVGSCGSVSVTADGSPVSATYNSSTGVASFTTTGGSITVYALNWTSGGTGAVTKATLYNNYHWAYSLTFDDNRLTQYENGKPLLDALGWRAGCAVVGSWANGGGGPGSGNYYMNWATLQSLRTAGWDMYNHSYDHPNPLTCNGTATDIGTELSRNQTLLQQNFPGYNCEQMVYPYENSTAGSCSGFPPSFLLSSECGGGSYNYVDTTLPFQAQRGGLFGTDDTAWKSLAAAAAGNSRPTWLVEYTHSVSSGSGAIADQYSTNAATLGDLLNYLNTNFGPSGNNSMWFAPAGEVRDYLFTRDDAVVSTCTVGSPVPTDTPTLAPTLTPTPTPVVQSSWRVNAGGPNYTDTQGNLWVADTNYSGGSTIASGGTISGTSDSTLYDTQRYGSPFSYSFNVPAGSYQVTLLFAETYSGDFSMGARIMSVSINGTVVTPSLDIYSQVGGSAADNLVYNNVSPSGGVITIQLASNGGTDANAVLEALQVIPMPATPTPTATSSPTSTASRTPTASPTSTATRTATSTATGTSTATPSSTPTKTATFTATSTSSSTPTETQTFTPSHVFTFTSTPSLTATPSSTPTGTPTSTVSATITGTPTETQTFTPSHVDTFTQTPTSTPSSTVTATTSATPSETPTSTPSPVYTFTPTATSTATATSSATDTPTLVNTATPSPTSTETQTFTPSHVFTSTQTPSSTATNTPTPSNTFAPSSTPTGTPTPTSTATSTPTPTVTQTFTPSHVNTFTQTPTSTPTSTPPSGPVPVVYPNPADGTRPVTLIPALSGESRVRVEFFTVAFRKVQDLDFQQVAPGQVLPLPVKDHWGRPLASGLYYLKVSTNRGRFTVKLLVLR